MPTIYIFPCNKSTTKNVEIINKKGDSFYISFTADGDLVVRKVACDNMSDAIAIVPSCSNQIYLK